MNKIINNEKQLFEKIQIVDKCGNCMNISVELLDDPIPQTIVHPSFTKEVMMIIGISFVIVIGLIVFAI